MKADLPPPRRPGALLAWIAALVLAVAALYAPTARNGFVDYDDGSYLLENPHVRGGLTAANARWAFLEFHSANWHPLTWLSHQLDVSLFGLEPGPHHLVNAALHALNAVLCFLFLRRVTGSLAASALVALLFAVHPQRVQSVAWASERKDVLAGTFFFLCLLAHAARARAPTLGRHAAVVACLALGLLAKPMLVTVPAVLLALDLWPLGRLDGAAGSRGRALLALLREKVPLLVLCLGSALVTLQAQAAGGAVQSIETLSLSERLATALQGSVLYLGQALVPVGLAFYYPHPALVGGGAFAPFGPRTLGAALLLAALSLGAWRARRRLPMLAAGWVWFLAMLLPVCGLVQVGTQFTADRYTYLPLLGPTIAVVFAARALLGAQARRLAFGAGLALALVYALVARAQVATWRDTRTLAERALAVTERNYVAHEHLGLALQREGALAEARAHYEAALAILPGLPSSHANLGGIHAQEGHPAEARAEFEEALRLDPSFLKARLSLGFLEELQGNPAAAAAHYERATEEHPEAAEAWKQLGDARLALGQAREAAAAFRAALERGPEWLEARVGLARALEASGEPRAALEAYAALERLAPQHEAARHGPAWIRATSRDPGLRDPAQALALLARCGALREPRDWRHLRVEAAALAAAGRPAEAARLVAEASAGAPRSEWERLKAEGAVYAAGGALER